MPGAGLVTVGILFGFGSADSRAAFDVASLKADNSRTGVDRVKRSAESLIVENAPLKRMIGMAYGIPDGRDYSSRGRTG